MGRNPPTLLLGSGMFWFGLIVAAVAGVISIGISRNAARRRFPIFAELHLDIAALVLLFVGLALSTWGHLASEREISELRDLSTRDIPKPLAVEVSAQAVRALSEWATRYPGLRVQLSLGNRDTLNAELVFQNTRDLLIQAGVPLIPGSIAGMSPGTRGPIVVLRSSEHDRAARHLLEALSAYVSGGTTYRDPRAPGAPPIEVLLVGLPTYQPNGSVRLR